MKRSALKNAYYKTKTDESHILLKRQKNYTKRLFKREIKKYWSNLDMSKFTDNKKFWNTVKPLFSNSTDSKQNITLVEDDNIITDDQEIAETFNQFFKKAVSSLGINENKALLNEVSGINDPVERAIKKFDCHPSVIDIRRNTNIQSMFSFSKVTKEDILKEIKDLNPKKSGTFMNIPVNILKDSADDVADSIVLIWNKEIIEGMKFATELKKADITPLHKKLANIYKENYRPVSLLPLVSKIFERIMLKQI